MVPRMANLKNKKHLAFRQMSPRSETDMVEPCARLAGLVHGAKVVTSRGLCPVESLLPQKHIIARDHGAVPITRIEKISLVTQAVYVIAGSLGHKDLDRDTLIPAAQTALLRDWRATIWAGRTALVQEALDLVDGEFVRDLGLTPVTLYRIFCDQPQIINADGLELGTADYKASALKSPVLN